MSVFSSAHQYQDLQDLWVNQREKVRNSYQEIQELARQIERLQREIETARKRVKLIVAHIKKQKHLSHFDMGTQCSIR